jgi:hypothetical protein
MRLTGGDMGAHSRTVSCQVSLHCGRLMKLVAWCHPPRGSPNALIYWKPKAQAKLDYHLSLCFV